MATKRDININTMVSLPLLNALTALVLAEQLIAYASRESLPPLIGRALGRIVEGVAILKARVQPQAEADTQEKRVADSVLDNAWRAVEQWLGALILVPGASLPGKQNLSALHNLLFNDGMMFINATYREQWAESETRLEAVAEGDYDAAIDENGGRPLFAHLEVAHQQYGEVLGISTPHETKSSPAIRESYLQLLDAIRAYVVKSVAYADPEEPGSEALSQRLIEPLVNWQDPTKRVENDTADSDSDAAV
jgi:hypothetical protein